LTCPDDQTAVEISAGVISYRCFSNTHKYLLIKHANGGHWSFPKGHVETGESLKESAVRELSEETDLSVKKFVSGFREKVAYHIRREGEIVRKRVVYFLARVTDGEVELSPEHVDFKWLSHEECLDVITYEDDRSLLNSAEQTLINQA